jgi:subtilisin family serine protease
MHEDPVLPAGGTDPLRFIDPRFEPQDPLFDCEEPMIPRPRKKQGAALTIAVLSSLACGGRHPTPLHATDSILVQLSASAVPPDRGPATDVEPPIVALSAVSDERGLLVRVPLEPGADAAAAVDRYASFPGVEFAEPVYLFRAAQAPNDARFKEQWGLARISAPAVWDKTTGKSSVVVAVVDDGVTLDHPDLAPNLWTNPNPDEDLEDVHGASFLDGEETGDPSPTEAPEMSFHGSHVAGIIAAAGDNRIGVAGVSWHASLMALKAFGPAGGRSDDLARAVDYAVDHGARIIDASWAGAGTSKVLAAAVERAGRSGVLFVTAAGNDSAAAPRFPANLALDNLISVGATDVNDALAPFSNKGALVAAPGVGILSTTSAGAYARYDGTSMASAHVAGIAALLWSAHPEASLPQVRSAILESAVEIPGAQHGRVDASRALAALEAAEKPEAGALVLSRSSLHFAGRAPRAQTISVRIEGGGVRSWSARSDASWVKLSMDQGETPTRVAVRVDPHKASGREAHVMFVDTLGSRAELTISLDGAAGLEVAGEGCSLSDGKLHARLGAGCTVSSGGTRWTLPDGQRVDGAKLYAQFVRAGEYQLLVDSTDPLPVVIE